MYSTNRGVPHRLSCYGERRFVEDGVDIQHFQLPCGRQIPTIVDVDSGGCILSGIASRLVVGEDGERVGITVGVREGAGQDVVVVDDVWQAFYFVGQAPRDVFGCIVQGHHPPSSAVLVKVEHHTLAAVGVGDQLPQVIFLCLQSQSRCDAEQYGDDSLSFHGLMI